MSECTVEVAHERILELIAVLRDAKLERIELELEDIESTYEMSITGVLLQYYSADASSMRAASEAYWARILSNGIAGRLAWCVNFITTVAACQSPGKNTLTTLAARASSIKLTITFTGAVCNECECGGVRENMPRISDRMCRNCGMYTEDTGILLDDCVEGYNTKQKKQKGGGHDTARHWRLWIQRIQAREKWETPPEVKDVVRAGFLRRGIREADRMHCCLIRMFLKEAGLTIHNDHVPSIRKDVCGIVPPQMTYDELTRGGLIFHKACEAFAEIKPKGVSNNPYYPYIARKILERILPDGDRKNRIMDCIHLQGNDTLVKNDRIWAPVCEIMDDPDVQYRPTNRAEYQIM